MRKFAAEYLQLRKQPPPPSPNSIIYPYSYAKIDGLWANLEHFTVATRYTARHELPPAPAGREDPASPGFRAISLPVLKFPDFSAD